MIRITYVDLLFGIKFYIVCYLKNYWILCKRRPTDVTRKNCLGVGGSIQRACSRSRLILRDLYQFVTLTGLAQKHGSLLLKQEKRTGSRSSSLLGLVSF